MAGDVVISVSDNGVLIILGDELDNEITVQSGDSPGLYAIIGGPGTNLIFDDSDDTNESSASQEILEVSGVTRGANITMRVGNDTVILQDFRIGGNVRIATGEGEDRVFVGTHHCLMSQDLLKPMAKPRRLSQLSASEEVSL